MSRPDPFTFKISVKDRDKTRFDRLPPQAQNLINDLPKALFLIAVSDTARPEFVAHFSSDFDGGMAEVDAAVAIVKDSLGLEPLSDEEFEYALCLVTPPEHRETAQ